MTHNEKRQAWYLEGLYTLIGGTVYGAASILVGHPLDTVKTKMQAQTTFMGDYGLITSIKQVYKQDGLKGFYAGALPPLLGSIVFRSLQFSVFESFYTYNERYDVMRREIPGLYGIQYRVVGGGLVASFARSVVECPFEYAKVKRQTGQTWQFNHAYHGFGVLYTRTTILMTTFFMFIDSFRRHTELMGSHGGNFIVSSVSATLAWLIVWPFENLKNQIQADTVGVGSTWGGRFRWMLKAHGLAGLYRGMVPGIICVSTRNGAAMVAMQYMHKTMTELGLRG